MSDAPAAAAAPAEGERGGFGRGGRGAGRGRGRGGPGGGRGRGRDGDKAEWVPVTKLGRMVQRGLIKSVEEIYLHSLPVKEHQIIDMLVPNLKDELMKIMPVQKQSCAGQRTRFKAFVALGDHNGHVGLGVKCASEAANAIKGALMIAKLSVVPVRRGYWGGKVGAPHTVPMKVTGKCGSVSVRLIPAPRGTGLVAAPATKKLISMAGVEDVYTSSTGHTRTMGNFIKAVYFALRATYGYLTPDLWKDQDLLDSPYDVHSDALKSSKPAAVKEVAE